MFFRPIGKPKCSPVPLIGWDIFDFYSKIPEQNSMKLDRKQDLNVLYQVCVFQSHWKTKMATPASDWLRYFWLETAERNSKEFERNEAICQHPLPSLCFLGWSENQDGRLASDWLRRFWLLIWNAEWNPTKFDRKEARSQQPLPSLCISGPSDIQDGHPFRSINKGGTLYSGAWYVALWAPCSRNLTESKISMSFST